MARQGSATAKAPRSVKKAGKSLDQVSFRQRFDARSLQRGQDYYRRGMIFDMRRQDATLKAHCRGTSAASYRVEAMLQEGEVRDASCTCPVGDGGYCKHVVAMLLTWQAKPEAFREVESVSKQLEGRPKEELIELIELMLKRHPDLEALLELIPSADAVVESDSYRTKTISMLQSAYDPWEEYPPGNPGPAAELAALRAIGDRFRDRENHRSAAAVYRGILEGIMQCDFLESGYGDELTDELISESSAIADALADCLRHLDENDAERAEARGSLLEWLKVDLRLGGIDLATEAFGIVVRTASADERADLLEQLDELRDDFEDGWAEDYLSSLILKLEEQELDDEAFLKRCRQLGQLLPLVGRLLTLGREKEVIAAAKEASDHDLCSIADQLVKHGCADDALRLVRGRLRGNSEAWQLERWLEDHATSSGDWETAAELAWKRFSQQPFLQNYHLFREYALQAGIWSERQQKAIAHAERKAAPSEFLHILLTEGRIEEAVERLQLQRTKSVPLELRRKIAREAESLRNEQAIALHWENVELLILQRSRDSYREACEDLTRLRELHRQLGRRDEWNEAIVGLKQEHRRLRALQEELKEAGV